MKPGMSRGLGISRHMAPMRMPSRQHAVSAKMWYSGSAVTIVMRSTCLPFLSAGCSQASFCSTLAMTLRCSSVAPFDTPVVPPVYCRKATSSRLMSGLASCRRRPAAIASLNLVAPGSEKAGTIFFTLRTTMLTIVPFGKPSRSPMLASTICCTGVLDSTCSKVLAKFSMMMMALAPESLS